MVPNLGQTLWGYVIKRSPSALIILIIATGVLACDRIIKKTEDVTVTVEEKTKDEFNEQTQKLANKVFPPFDHDKADTENNKKRFSDFIKVEITPDVKNIYCFDDAMGINADYMFAFNCNSVTSRKIIEIHNLTIDTMNPDNAFGLQNDFAWWDKSRIAASQKYSWTDGEQYFKYYWYDEKNSKAYFFDFDM